MKSTFLALFLTVAASHASAQAPTWRVDFLGPPQPSWSLFAAQAVNDAGTVAGITYLSGFKHAWISAPNQTLELLPLPPGATWSEANDINASGVVAGSVLIGGASQAIVWQPGPSGYQYVLVPSGPGGVQPFDARGITDAGEVVGKLGVLSGSYVWTPGASVTQITTATFPVVPEDINNARQIVGDTYRMDLDTMVLEDLGDPTGTGYNYMYTKLSVINDAGQCGGYAVVATGQTQNKQAVRYTDGAGWKAFNSFPMTSANVMGLSASGDASVQLGVFGLFVYAEGFGSIALQNTIDPAYAHWDVTGSFAPYISPGSLLAGNGLNTVTGEAGIVLLTPLEGGPQVYCTPKVSSAGCVASISTSSGAQPVSGAVDYSVSASQVQELKNGLLFAGISGPANLPFSGGTLCVQPPTKRGPVASSGGANPSSCNGAYGTLVNDGMIVPTGLDAGPGSSGWYQYWYRDPQNGAGALGTALSDAVRLDFQ